MELHEATEHTVPRGALFVHKPHYKYFDIVPGKTWENHRKIMGNMGKYTINIYKWRNYPII
jgi:aspartate/tyrosine/aromatic aminotransferase